MSGENMKAVAGMLSNTREMPLDDDEIEEAGSDAPTHYLPVIDRICELATDSIAGAIRQTPCFGHLWEDEAGICPEAGDCEIAPQCKSVYLEVETKEEPEVDEEPVTNSDGTQDRPEAVDAFEAADVLGPDASKAMEEIVDATEPDPEPELVGASISTPGALAPPKKKGRKSKKKPAANRPFVTPKKGKYKGTGKYERHGYYDMGRPVDESIRRFVHELGYPFELPKNWSWAKLAVNFGDKGRVLLAKTTSYHAVIIDNRVVCRAWTNAAGYSIVDLSELLVAKLKTLKIPVEDIPKKSKDTKKYQSFEGRFYMKSVDDAERLAKWIKEAYKLGPKKKKTASKSKKKQLTRKGKANA
jgi:hypothetical protein